MATTGMCLGQLFLFVLVQLFGKYTQKIPKQGEKALGFMFYWELPS
jgi:hypothetical protein